MAVSIEERVATLEATQKSLVADTGELKGEMRIMRDDIHADLAAIRADLSARPSWAVTTYLTLVSAACSILATLLVVS